jgi:hypothetical protein
MHHNPGDKTGKNENCTMGKIRQPADAVNQSKTESDQDQFKAVYQPVN